MNINIKQSWKKELGEELKKDYFKTLTNFVHQEYLNKTIYPKQDNIFNAFNLCSFHKTKVIIIGQDPYHGPHQAHGLCFSVQNGVKIPPSLKNIFKELRSDQGITMSNDGNLTTWGKQGILLLNATLTVVSRKAGSHQKKGWETFTDAVIKTISDKKENVVFLLWGAFAQGKAELIDQNKHLILKAPHPSPLSAHRGFIGCQHFSLTNKYLKQTNQTIINWKL